MARTRIAGLDVFTAFEVPRATQLADLPTIAQGQAEDLKMEEFPYRVWLSRCGPEDGETHRVSVEECINGRWTQIARLEPY